MMELLWTPEAIRNREDIYDYIEEDNPLAALSLDDLISERTAMLQDDSGMGRAGTVLGTFELVIHSSYMVVYDIAANTERRAYRPAVAAAGRVSRQKEQNMSAFTACVDWIRSRYS